MPAESCFRDAFGRQCAGAASVAREEERSSHRPRRRACATGSWVIDPVRLRRHRIGTDTSQFAREHVRVRQPEPGSRANVGRGVQPSRQVGDEVRQTGLRDGRVRGDAHVSLVRRREDGSRLLGVERAFAGGPARRSGVIAMPAGLIGLLSAADGKTERGRTDC